MSKRSRSRRTTGLTLGVLFVAAALPYLGILDSPFVFDDVKLVEENALFRQAESEPALLWDMLNIASQRWADDELRPNYRPLRFFSYLVDYRLTRWWYGDNVDDELPPFFFHLSNVLLHALNTLLVGVLALVLLRPLSIEEAVAGPTNGSQESLTNHRLLLLGSVSAALVFAWHPIHTEAVTYISGRRDVLSTFFFLLALWLSTRDSGKHSPTVVAIVLTIICFVCGLLTKEMVVTLPPALLLVDVWRQARLTGRRIVLHVALWLVALTFAGLTVANKSLIVDALFQDDEVLFLTACRYVMHYLGLLVLPITQTLDYSFDVIQPSTSLTSPWTTAPAVFAVSVLVLGGIFALLRWRRGSAHALVGLAGLGALWVVGTLVPVLQFVPIPERFAERFLYLPSFGFVLLVAGFLLWLRRRDPLVSTGALVLVALALLVSAVRRNSDWKSPLTLWTAAAEIHPRCARAQLARGHALRSVGRDREAAQAYTRALEIFEERPQISLHHGYILQALTFRGALYGALQPPDRELLEQAVTDYRRVLGEKDTDGEPIADSPRHTAVHFDLAGFLIKLERLEEAVVEYRRVIAIGRPTGLVGAAHFYLGQIARQKSDTEAAITSFRSAFAVSPNGAPETFHIAAVLADLLIDRGKLVAVEEIVAEAIERGARVPEKSHLLLRHAKARDRLGDLSGAMEILANLLKDDEGYLPALVTLAGIETNLGQFDAARERYERVLARQPGEPQAVAGLQRLRIQEKLQQNDPETREASLVEIEHKGREHLQKGELLAAREVFAKLLEKATERKDLRVATIANHELADLEERLGRTAIARQYLVQLLQSVPEDPEILLRLGDLSLRRPLDRERAKRYYEQYLAALPEGQKPQPHVYVNLATLVVRDEPTRALEFCDRAKKLGCDLPALDAARGYALAGGKQWESALDAFNRYLERAPESDTQGRDRVRRFVTETVLESLLGSDEAEGGTR